MAWHDRGTALPNYEAGFRYGKLGYDLVEERGLRRFQARTYMSFGNLIMPWTRHVQTGRSLVRRAFDAANKMGDLTFAAYSCNNLATNLLAAGDPLVDVQREAENGLEFAKNARFGLVIDIITTQLALVRTLRGSTAKFGSFDDGQFDELRFERHLASDPVLALPECWYWIRKLQARCFAEDYPSAVQASLNAQRLLWTSPSFFEVAEYHFYGALAQAAYCVSAPACERQHHADALAGHHRQLQVWAESCPENFENRAALVGAEIARIEGRDVDAMRLYEQAIRSARVNGFIHNEALANELASRFYAARGFEKIARVYLQDARHCYLRWGADGKVRQLEETYPHLRTEEPAPGPMSTIATPVERLDLATVIKVSQAVSGEMVLEKLLDTLMRTAIAQAGAERGLLILSRGAEPQIAAEATTGGDTVRVELRDAPVTASLLSETVLHYVLHTQESVILDDAATQSPFADDPYIRGRKAHSILCLPLINQAKLIGVLYLENNLTPRAFAPARIAVLKLLASQAAISLENTRLYGDLEQREAKIRRLVDANIIGIFIWERGGPILEANDAFLRTVGYDREDFIAGRLHRSDLTPFEWRDSTMRGAGELKVTGAIQPYEKEYVRKDGSRVPVLVGAASFDETGSQGVAFVVDLSERNRAEQELRSSEARFRTFVDHATDAFMLHGEDGTVLDVNRHACESLGYSRDELIGMSTIDFDPDADAAFLRNINESLDAGRILTFERRHRRKDGIVFPVEVRVREFRQGGGRLVISLTRDITGRKRAEAEARESERRYREMQTELAHANRVATMGQLTASIAHEVNQPIAAAVTNALAARRWMCAQPPNLEEVRQALGGIVENGTRAGEVISRIRALVKRAPPRKDGVAINDAILEVVSLTHGEAAKNRVAVRAQLAEGLPIVEGDRVQLQQVILNLIVNAVEAMSGTNEAPRDLLLSTEKAEPDGVLVTVRDSGPGLAPEKMERLFDAFYTTKPTGMGMGLSICRSIIEAHDGRLWASANEPRGAVFQFTVPAHPEHS